MRIDVYLCEAGITDSRTEAKSLITEGAVFLDGRQIMKPSFDISGFEDRVTVDKSRKPFVSRGGLKLDGALEHFGIDVANSLCLDIGASSGGFTDCLLQRGAAHVIAVDSGSGQLSDRLREDPRITSIEGYNARYMKPCDLEYSPDFVVMDVSFISATYIIPAISECIAEGGRFVCLIKPQFEVGRANVGKGGIVKDDEVRQSAVRRVVDFASDYGFKNVGVVQSQIRGGDGNVEFLGYFLKS